MPGPQDVSNIELVIAACVAVQVAVRLVLCVLAAFAAHKALNEPVGDDVDAQAIRAHRLAVLEVTLAALTLRRLGRDRDRLHG